MADFARANDVADILAMFSRIGRGYFEKSLDPVSELRKPQLSHGVEAFLLLCRGLGGSTPSPYH